MRDVDSVIKHCNSYLEPINEVILRQIASDWSEDKSRVCDALMHAVAALARANRRLPESSRRLHVRALELLEELTTDDYYSPYTWALKYATISYVVRTYPPRLPNISSNPNGSLCIRTMSTVAQVQKNPSNINWKLKMR